MKNIKSSITYIPFFIGLALNILVVLMFSKTVISLMNILMLYLIPGILLYFILIKFIIIEESKFLTLVYTTVSLGSLITCIVLSINLFIYPSNDIKTIKTQIARKGFTSRGKQPTADIEIDGITKGIVFSKSQDLTNYSYVELKTRDGVLGWKIIESAMPK